MWSINVILRPLEYVDFVVVDVVIVVVNICILKLLKATIEFLWWVGVHSHFCVQHNYSVEVVLCFVVIGVVTS